MEGIRSNPFLISSLRRQSSSNPSEIEIELDDKSFISSSDGLIGNVIEHFDEE